VYVALDLTLAFFIFKIKNKATSIPLEGISIIIATRNEADNLKVNLRRILQQNHPRVEVIVVNDNSTDETLSILKTFKVQYPILRYITVESKQPSKKKALTKGIDMSTYDTLCFTDADCHPLSSHWLSVMQNHVTASTPIVLGFSPYSKYSGVLNSLIRFETLQTGLNYFGFAKMGMPYMAVGRNLMYKKDVFRSVNGFKHHEHLRSGDDDLLINAATTHFKVDLCLDPETFVESSPETSLNDWIAQKRRHISTASHYNPLHQLVLGFQFIIRLLFWYGGILSVFILPVGPVWKISSFLFFGMIMLLKILFTKGVFRKFKSEDLLLKSPVLEFLVLNVQLYIFFINLIQPKKDW